MFVYTLVLYSIVVSFIANSYAIVQQEPQSLFVLIPIFLFVNIFAGKEVEGKEEAAKPAKKKASKKAAEKSEE